MVVGGLPIRNDKHAEHVCNQALDMLHYCKQVNSPVDGTPINVCLPSYLFVSLTVFFFHRSEWESTVEMLQLAW